MSAKFIRAFIATGALAGLCASWGCVSDRPSRNGVFNENQYLRKAFLVRPGDGSKVDNGWMLKATIVKTSTPNPLAGVNLWTGAENGGAYVRFDVTQDKLRMLNVRELTSDAQCLTDYGTSDPTKCSTIGKQGTREPEVVNAWPITNVDLKYRINLDGEKTNFYEENQELDWKVRQWVKVNFAKNDLSDVAVMGPYAAFALSQCTDTSNATATMVPDSLNVDEKNDYISWKVDITVPVKFDVAACTTAYGANAENFQKFGRSNVSMQLMYSMVRAVDPSKITYTPLVLAEKDAIRRKYGVIDSPTMARDPETGLLGARQLTWRFDPKKPLVYYFAPGYPEEYKTIWTGKGGIVDQTNDLFAAAKADIRMSVKNFDADLAPGQAPREVGDIRYSFVRWESDIDINPGFIGVAQFVPDPRTGELISASINLPDFQLKDRALQRLDFYLRTLGAQSAFVDPNDPNSEWADGPAGCKDGDVIPLVSQTLAKEHNATSPVYSKMQEYLQKPVSKFGNLAPSDFIVKQDADFFRAYYAILPYQVFQDPAANFFTTPEGGTGAYAPAAQFQLQGKVAEYYALAGQLQKGWIPYDATTGPQGLANATAFLDKFKDLTLAHRDYQYAKTLNHGRAQYDSADAISYIDVFQKDARHCINGAWESRADYVKNLLGSYRSQIIWHEFGHTIGLQHNFMGSVDRPNFPHYTDGAGRDHIGQYASTVMEYNTTADRVFWKNETGNAGWGPYDRGAISFIYGNALDKDHAAPDGDRGLTVSGQTDIDHPWHDPNGFDAATGKEKQFLNCGDTHTKYTPLCRQFDFGSTPSEIIAHEIDDYEWGYRWANFRLYRKFFNESGYVARPTQLITDMRRFLSAWAFDWQSGEVTDTLRRIGITAPPNTPQATYYANLTAKFQQDISVANQLVATFHKAVIQQSSGERPYKTLYDNFYGDVTQQGIIVDKLLALQSWTALWKTDNYDPLQAQGGYMSSYSQFGDTSYETVAEDAVDSMIGGQYDIFAYGKPLAVAAFSQATHDVNFGGRIEVRDWIGGRVFYRERDFLDHVRGIAVKYHAFGCTSLDTCTYDPRVKRVVPTDQTHSDNYNEYLNPEGRRMMWAYVADRNAWTLVDRDRNTAAYVIMRAYNADVVFGEDDGNTGAYRFQLPVKYFLDSYNQYN